MKKTHVKRIASLILVMLFCFATVGSVSANVTDPGVLSPKNVVIRTTENSLTVISSGNLNCYGKTTVPSGYTAAVTVELQKYSGGWSTIKTWTASARNSATVDENRAVTSGYRYRLKLTHKAYTSDGTLVESIVKYSNEV